MRVHSVKRVNLLYAKKGFDASKYKICLVLQLAEGQNLAFNSKQLAALTGLPFSSVASLLTRYYYMGYVGRNYGDGVNETTLSYYYYLLAKGRRFLDTANNCLLSAGELYQEVMEWYTKQGERLFERSVYLSTKDFNQEMIGVLREYRACANE